MANKVENAVGTALQYMPNEKTVYQNRLIGVQQNWNVVAEQDYNLGNVSKAMEALGIAVSNDSLEKERRDFEVAQALAPQAFYTHNAKQKRTLDAVAMLANVGEYNLSDNRYAVGVIDKLRGEYIAQQDYQEYKTWSETQPLAKDMNEENARYDKFMTNKQDEWLNANKGIVQNSYAYNVGRTGNAYERITDNINDYQQKREQQNTQDYVLGMQAKMDSLSRSVMYKTLSKEERQQKLMELMTDLNVAQAKNPEVNVKLLQYFMESLAKNTGDYSLIQYLGEFQAYNGKFVKDIIDPSTYAELANATAETMQNQLKIEDTKWADGFTTSAGLTDAFEKLQTDDPELARRRAGEYNRRRNQLKAQEEADKRAKERQQRQTGIVGNQKQSMTGILDKIVNGDFVGIPQTEDDLKQYGFTDMGQIEEAMREYVDRLVIAGDDANLAKIAKYPVFAKGMKKYFEQHLDVDIIRGEMTPAIKMAVNLAGKDGSYIEAFLGEKHASSIRAIKLLTDVFGEEGMQRFKEAQPRLNDPEEKRRLTEELSATRIPSTQVYDLYYDAPTSYSYNINTTPFKITRQIRETALILRATPYYSAEQAQASATEAVMQQFVGVHSMMIPKNDYAQVVNATSKATNRSFEQAISYYTNGYSQKSEWQSDGSQIYLSVMDNTGHTQRIELAKIKRLADEYADNPPVAPEKTPEETIESAKESTQYQGQLWHFGI